MSPIREIWLRPSPDGTLTVDHKGAITTFEADTRLLVEADDGAFSFVAHVEPGRTVAISNMVIREYQEGRYFPFGFKAEHGLFRNKRAMRLSASSGVKFSQIQEIEL